VKFAKTRLLLCCTHVLLLATALNAQQAATSSTTAVVPQLVNYSGKATDAQGKPIAGIAVSHFPAHVWDSVECKWRESEGCAGVVAPREPEGHDGRLHAGRRASDARGAKQFGQAGPKRLQVRSQVQLSGSNWIMKKNGDFAELLYFVGVPDGI
jgi:hypothetical protein